MRKLSIASVLYIVSFSAFSSNQFIEFETELPGPSRDINNNYVVGWMNTDFSHSPYRYNIRTESLESLNITSGNSMSINNANDIALTLCNPTCTPSIWKESGETIEIHDINLSINNYLSSKHSDFVVVEIEVSDLNNSGDLVGEAKIYADNTPFNIGWSYINGHAAVMNTHDSDWMTVKSISNSKKISGSERSEDYDYQPKIWKTNGEEHILHLQNSSKYEYSDALTSANNQVGGVIGLTPVIWNDDSVEFINVEKINGITGGKTLKFYNNGSAYIGGTYAGSGYVPLILSKDRSEVLNLFGALSSHLQLEVSSSTPVSDNMKNIAVGYFIGGTYYQKFFKLNINELNNEFIIPMS